VAQTGGFFDLKDFWSKEGWGGWALYRQQRGISCQLCPSRLRCSSSCRNLAAAREQGAEQGSTEMLYVPGLALARGWIRAMRV